MIYTALAALAITFLTQLIKSYVFPKWGANGVHAVVFILALAGAGIGYAVSVYPTLASFVNHALELLAGSVALYEVILKKIGTIDVPSDPTADANSTAFQG